MPKRKRIAADDIYCFYRRNGGGTIWVRDSLGRCDGFIINGDQVKYVSGGESTLGPDYGRTDWSNSVRFTANIGPKNEIISRFTRTRESQKLSSGEIQLSPNASANQRAPNQGMSGIMHQVTGIENCSATTFVNWYKQQTFPEHTLLNQPQWEWCHLLAHCMGGVSGEENIVIGAKHNNSEQMYIENAIQRYRKEEAFAVKITAACLDDIKKPGGYIASVIEYKIIAIDDRSTQLTLYLDCLNPPKPSEIHQENVIAEVASFCNKMLSRFAPQVSAREKNLIKRYIAENG